MFVTIDNYNGMDMVGHDDIQRNFRIGIINRYLGKTIFCNVSNFGQLHDPIGYFSKIIRFVGSAYCDKIDTPIIFVPCDAGRRYAVFVLEFIHVFICKYNDNLQTQVNS